jgi:hypothetical protein
MYMTVGQRERMNESKVTPSPGFGLKQMVPKAKSCDKYFL